MEFLIGLLIGLAAGAAFEHNRVKLFSKLREKLKERL